MFRNQRMPIPSDSLPSVVENLLEFLKESVELLEAMYKEVDFEDREMEDTRTEFEEAAGEEKDCVENLLDALGSIIRSSRPAVHRSSRPAVHRSLLRQVHGLALRVHSLRRRLQHGRPHALRARRRRSRRQRPPRPLLLLPTYDDGDNECKITYDETKMEIMKILKSLDRRQRNGLLNGLEPDMRMAVSSILNN